MIAFGLESEVPPRLEEAGRNGATGSEMNRYDPWAPCQLVAVETQGQLRDCLDEACGHLKEEHSSLLYTQLVAHCLKKEEIQKVLELMKAHTHVWGPCL